MYELHTASDGGAEADAVIGAEDVVIHGLRDRDDFDPFAMQSLSIAECVVAADGYEYFDAEILKVLKHVWGEVLCVNSRRGGPRLPQKGRGLVGIEGNQAAPSTSYPNYVVTCVYRAVDYCFDTGV